MDKIKELFQKDYGFGEPKFNEYIIYDNTQNFDQIKNQPMAKGICFNSLKQSVFEEFINNFSSQFEYIQFFKTNLISDLSPLGKLKNIRYIKYFLNNKAVDLWDMSQNKSLQGIDFTKFTKITKLDYLTTANNLEELTLDVFKNREDDIMTAWKTKKRQRTPPQSFLNGCTA
jgi:hypothetical protein